MSGPAATGGAGAAAVVRLGHLRKLKTMKKKFFVLRGESAEGSARLEYYESEKKYRAGALPRRALPLHGCYNIMRRLDLKQKHVIALFTSEEQFCIVAENEQDLHGWLTAILTCHHDEPSEDLLHPIQHVWQVNVQKKGLGATKNIHGLYNLCLADKTLTLVKIKSQNNVIGDLGIPERVEYTLKNIRRCGDSECFFYMEVGRQTTTGAGELWMHTDDSNIAQSMHSTILHAMRHCAKESENERDHIVIPKSADGTLTARRSTFSDGQTRPGHASESGLCVGSCIRQCVCAGAEDSAAALAPLAPLAGGAHDADYQHNTLTDKPKHCRTGSLPGPTFQEPLKISHKRTWSEPLTGEEMDKGLKVEKAHSSCKAVNGIEPAKKSQCTRRASTGMRFKLSPAHSKNQPSRSRCDSMPASSRAVSSFEVDRAPPRLNDIEGLEVSRDETDAMAEWYRTPRIPEEPDVCEISKDLFNMSMRPSSSIQHSRTSSMGVDDPCDGYLGMEPLHPPTPLALPLPAHAGFLAMTPHEPSGFLSASSGSVCSGTPSTDPRFSEYQLEPATSHIGMECRPPRAYSVGSRPASAARHPERHRAYSVGASVRARPAHHPPASAEDLMLLDFTTNSHSPAHKNQISRTPPSYMERRPVDEYVDMSPCGGATPGGGAAAVGAGYVEMRPGEPPTPATPAPAHVTPLATPQATPEGYVEMTYGPKGHTATRPIAISASRPLAATPTAAVACSPEEPARRVARTPAPHGSQTIFPFSLESPASPDPGTPHDDPSPSPATVSTPHPLTTLREISEESAVPAKRTSELPVSSSPQYVQLTRPPPPAPAANKTLARLEPDRGDGRSTTTATVVMAGAALAPARFSVATPASPPSPSPGGPSASFTCAPLHYAALDLAAAAAAATPPLAPPAPRTYTKIDWTRSEKLHAGAADST